MNRYEVFAEPWRQHEMSMDVRHARMLGNFLRSLKPLDSVIEVGSCFGVSTAEVLAACEAANARCTLIDLVFQEPIKKMLVEACGRVRAYMVSDHSASILHRYMDENTVVLLDGDHRRCYMELEDEALVHGGPPRALILHDIASHRIDCDGPRWMLHQWQSRGYRVALDYMPREGERTERGLGILCRDAADAEIARAACAA